MILRRNGGVSGMAEEKPPVAFRLDSDYRDAADLKTTFIFYRPTDDGIEVLRVLHGKRDIEEIFDE
jgi:plasmid stabilization system protein ParE